jgi:GH15 family glucan-1,4-alpha-glucosidase
MSWAGCDHLARIGRRLGAADAAGRWQRRSDDMRRQILATGWSERRQSFIAAAGGDDLDASVLLLPELGLLSATDPRFVSTVATLGRELSEGPLLYRYRHEDDFGKPEAAFTVCAFWYVNALAATGEVERAREQFVQLLKFCSPLGLLSEDIDPRTGGQWGNFPQTYSLVGLINSAMRLSESWEDAF